MDRLTQLAVRIQAALRRSEDGAAATEYAVIVAIVVAALVGLFGIFNDALVNLWEAVVAGIESITGNIGGA